MWMICNRMLRPRRDVKEIQLNLFFSDILLKHIPLCARRSHHPETTTTASLFLLVANSTFEVYARQTQVSVATIKGLYVLR
jgi:hypothetical protein